MHLHILGICGTFMGGLALLARAQGHRVTGCDQAVYPPMSTQLTAQGIELIEGFAADQIALRPDVFVIGNVVSRGNPLLEAILEHKLAYTSGPQWLGEQLLPAYQVYAVAGTHGKTTTSAMLAWIFESAGRNPSFLIGGVPQNFPVSARLNPATEANAPFIVEADEYDTAFFDKRSKFLHYRPTVAILNNLEFDHADIFPDLAAIETQFHHLVRTLPRNGAIIAHHDANNSALERVLARGNWTPSVRFGAEPTTSITPFWHIDSSGTLYETTDTDQIVRGQLQWQLTGRHNQLNALAAILAARHANISIETSLAALSQFASVKRRMERRGEAAGVTVYDDFAHHPTAIQTTLEGARQLTKGQGRLIAVIEPRSNTMKLGPMKAALVPALAAADYVFAFGQTSGANALSWDLAATLGPLGQQAQTFNDHDALAQAVARYARAGDVLICMSNGSFGNMPERCLNALHALAT